MRPSPLYARAGGDGVRSPHRFLLPCDSLQLKTRKLLDAHVQRLRRPGTLHSRVLQQPPHPCLLPLAKRLSSSCTACSSWKRLVLGRRPFDNTQADTSAPSARARAHAQHTRVSRFPLSACVLGGLTPPVREFVRDGGERKRM
jgi:hypothetical protein